MRPTPKEPIDPTVRDITERVRAAQKKNNPKGVPINSENIDCTCPDFPLRNVLPRDPGWMNTRMITGSGNGPELGAAGLF
jgi:hypothetical protein